MKLIKLLVIFLFSGLFIVANAQYSVMSNDEKISEYTINEDRTHLPIYLGVSSSLSNTTITAGRVSRKTLTFTVVNSPKGWTFNNNYIAGSGKVVGLGMDFATGKIYLLTDELTERIIKTMATPDVIRIGATKDDNNDLGIVIVDAGVLRRERLDRFQVINNAQIAYQHDLLVNPIKPDVISISIEPNKPSTGVIVENRPLITAAANGQLDLAKKLLTNGENINETDPTDGDNALLKSIRTGNTAAVDMLLNMGIDQKHRNRYGQAPIHLASEKGYYDVVKQFLLLKNDANQADNNGNTPLMYASVSPNAALVDLILETGGKINALNKENKSALAFAAFNGNTKTVEALINRGADIHTADKDGNTILMQAVKGGSIHAAQNILKKSNKDLNTPDKQGKTPLHATIEQRDLELLGMLLGAGANVNIKDYNSNTPLMLAVEEKFENAVKLILENGSDVYLVNNNNETAYDIAIRQGNNASKNMIATAIKEADSVTLSFFEQVLLDNYDGTEYYLKKGAKPDTADISTGNTPLIVAVANNNTKIMELLLTHKANINWQNKSGNTALIVSVSTGDLTMVKRLVAKGADLNKQNANGDTALLWAVKLKKETIVKELLISGANSNIKNNDDISPLAIASGENNENMTKILKSFGAF